MKSKMLVAMLLGCLVWQQGALSQTDTPATDTNQSIGTSTVNPSVAPDASTNDSPNVAADNGAVASTATPPTAPAASTNDSPNAAAGNDAAASTATPPTAPATSTVVSTVATSSVAALTVVFPASIATEPTSQTIISGNGATFSVAAGGTPPLGYQWYFNDSPINDGTAANYTIISVTASNAGNYLVVITNSCGIATSSVAILTVVFPPAITAQPAGQTVVNGSNATFSVAAEGTPPLSYQWYFNGTAINGATSASYTINGVTTNNEGNYTVVITNSCGSVTSSNLTVASSVPNPPEPAAVSASETPGASAGSDAAGAVAVNPPVVAVVSANGTSGANAANPPVAAAVSANEIPGAVVSNETTAASATNPPVATASSTGTNEIPSMTNSNATAAAGATNLPMATVSSTGTNEIPGVTNSNAAAAAGGSNSQSSATASIPLIQFQDVPITTAIENLARQAGINYLLDPKIGYGQPDANGQVKPEPTLSIRWENITAAQALVALLDNYGLQITEDRQTHIGRITTKDPSAPPPLATRVFQIKYAGTSNMVGAAQATLFDKRSKVLPDQRTSQLIVVATEPELDAVDTLIKQLDKPTRQVLIETKLVEISSNPTTKKGVDWTTTLQAQNVSFGNGAMSGQTTVNMPGTPVTTTTTGFGGHAGTTSTTTPDYTEQTILNVLQGSGGMSLNTLSGLTPAIGFLNADGVHAVLSYLNTSSDAQVVSTPRLVTLDNETAVISVTRGYPVINVVASTVNAAGGSSITYSNIGTILQVTPHISANDYIWLKVVPDVSSFFGVHQQTIAGSTYTADIFDSRHIETQVLIPNANTLVMGGLVQDNPNAQYTKVPLLGDIPGLGWAFRSETKSLAKANLLIFITPTIVKEGDFRPAPTDFLQSQPNTIRSPMNPNNMMDSAQLKGDWSNPVPVPGEFDKK